MLFKMQPHTLSTFFAARLHSSLLTRFLFTRTARFFSDKKFSSWFYMIAGDYNSPGSGFCISPCWTSWDFPQLNSSSCQDPSKQQIPCCIRHFSHFIIICELAGGSVCATVQVINEGVKEYWPQYQSLGYTTSYLPPTGLHATYDKILDPAAKPVFSLHHSPPI